MPRRLIRRYLPDFEVIRKHKSLRFLGEWLHDPNLWHLNRSSVAKGFAIGLFWAFAPLPFQSIPSALCAIYFRANLPISIVLVWITNPLTLAPVFYFCYALGAWILQTPPLPVVIEESWGWRWIYEIMRLGKPFLLGSFIVSASLSLLGYYGMQLLWRWHVVRDWERRRIKRRAPRKASK